MVPHFRCTGVFEDNWNSDKYITINRGGTRSSKTHSLIQLFTSLLLDYDPEAPKILSIARKKLTWVKPTAMRDFITFLRDENLYQYLHHNKTENTFEYPAKTNRTPNILEFFGLDDEQKVRGRKRTHLWVNEANEINEKDFQQLMFRTSKKIFLDFNPDDEGVWINRELEQQRAAIKKDVKVIVSSYLDNTFLDEQERDNIEYLKIVSPDEFKTWGMGEYGRREGVVFENYELCDEIPPTAEFIAYGLDFGFTNDPTAVVEVYKQDGALWINEMLYERRLTNPDVCSRLTAFRVQRNQQIIADSADPRSIEEIFRLGFNIYPAEKGPDSIISSIDILKRYPLKITARSQNLITELRTYKWQKDKNGEALNKPVDYNNHAIDALRYVALNKLNSKRSGVYHIR